jgi:predicted nucleic acid-binding protein
VVAITGKLPLVAVDSNVLLDLADDVADVWDAINTIRERLKGVRIGATSSVLQELGWLSENAEDLERQGAAQTALGNFTTKWKFIPIDFIPVGHAIIEQTASRIRTEGLLPQEEIQDSLIIAEAALAECTILLSSDAHICDIDQTRLSLVLDKCDINKVLVTSPAKIVKTFFQRR